VCDVGVGWSLTQSQKTLWGSRNPVENLPFTFLYLIYAFWPATALPVGTGRVTAATAPQKSATVGLGQLAVWAGLEGVDLRRSWGDERMFFGNVGEAMTGPGPHPRVLVGQVSLPECPGGGERTQVQPRSCRVPVVRFMPPGLHRTVGANVALPKRGRSSGPRRRPHPGILSASPKR
jgi:hypothetical protein